MFVDASLLMLLELQRLAVGVVAPGHSTKVRHSEEAPGLAQVR